MSEEAVQSEAPAAPAPAAEEAPAPESYNIFSDEPANLSPEGLEPAAPEQGPPREREGEQFLNRMKEDRQRRSQEISIKQKEQALAHQTRIVQQQMAEIETLRTDPNEFLQKAGIDPLDFQRKLAEHALHGGPSPEERLDRTQMELAKLKQAIAQKEQQQQKQQLIGQQEAAVKGFVSNIDQFRSQNENRFPLVTSQMQATEIAEGMAALYKQTGQQITIEEACVRLEAGLKKHEESFYNDPKNREKFQQYSGATKSVRGPQATMSSGWKAQPTRTDPGNELSFDEIKKMYVGKLFT